MATKYCLVFLYGYTQVRLRKLATKQYTQFDLNVSKIKDTCVYMNTQVGIFVSKVLECIMDKK